MPGPLRPFRFGVQVANPKPVEEWKEQARRIEALGYDTFLMPDHFGNQFAIGPALAIAAEATSTLRIGTLVWQNDLRHPALLAQEAASLDVLSCGRFEFGIGAGGSSPAEYDRTGIPFAPPGERVSRLEESIRVINGLAGDEPLTFSGSYYSLDGYQGYPKPAHRPPLLIAGGGDRMLGLAAREADIVGLLPKSLGDQGGFAEEETFFEAFEAKVARVRDVAGERFGGLELNVLIQSFVATDDALGEREHLRTLRGRINDGWFNSPMVYIGPVSECVDRMMEVRACLGISYFVIFEQALEEFAPVVAALAGR